MCGRFAIISSPEAIQRLFGYAATPNFPARYNVAPTQPIPTVMLAGGARQFKLMRWGLIPGWAKDPAKVGLLINARAETVLDKPSFRNAMRYRRCLIPADGYYEWRQGGGLKQPLFVHPAKGGPIAFAGLAETWLGPNGEEMDTVAIATTAASADLAGFHPRMPAVLVPEAFDIWLDTRAADAMTALSLLIPARVGTFRWHEVSNAVNRVANDDASLIEPLTEEQRAREAPRDKTPPNKDNQFKLF